MGRCFGSYQEPQAACRFTFQERSSHGSDVVAPVLTASPSLQLASIQHSQWSLFGKCAHAFAILTAIAVMSVASATSDSSSNTSSTVEPHGNTAIAHPRILVRFKPVKASDGSPINRAIDASEANKVHASLGTRLVHRYEHIPGLDTVEVPIGVPFDQVLEKYQQHPLVLYAERDQTVSTQAL
jgi:hypothetical protein